MGASRLTQEQINLQKIETRKIGDDLANDPSISSQIIGEEKSIEAVIETVKTLEAAKSPVSRKAAEKLANEFGANLLLLCLKQQIESNPSLGYMGVGNAFDDGVINEGNSKEYIATKMTGTDTYISEQFIPKKISKKSVESHVIQMYDAAHVLSKKAYQFKKAQTIQAPTYLPFFKSGSLSKFISEITEQIHKIYAVYKFDKIASLITTAKYQKEIVGTANNMFDAISGEFLPELTKMKYLNTEFNFSATSKFAQDNNIEDLIIIMSSGNLQRLKSGIKTQLFNAQLMGVNNELNDENVTCLGNKIRIGNSDTDIVVEDVEYCDDNTIYVLSKNALKHVTQVNTTETQAWAENMTNQITLHVWGAVDFLPWGQCFKYTNPNLSTLPKI